MNTRRRLDARAIVAPMTLRRATPLLLLLATACPGDKGGTETTGGPGGSTEATAATGSSETSTAASTEASTEASTAASTAVTTGGDVNCAAFVDEASCNAAMMVETRCQWAEIKQVSPDMCVFGGTSTRCIEVTINDGGCSPCLYKELGGGDFEVVDLGVNHSGCQQDAEFSSCYLFEPGQDPPVCACVCEGFQP